jgi:hypothetical protein
MDEWIVKFVELQFQLLSLNQVLLTYVGSSLIWPGIFLNCLVLLVLLQQKANSSTLYYLKTLAVTDIVLLTLIFMNHSVWWIVGDLDAQ